MVYYFTLKIDKDLSIFGEVFYKSVNFPSLDSQPVFSIQVVEVYIFLNTHVL
jgi:hypothetical protein